MIPEELENKNSRRNRNHECRTFRDFGSLDLCASKSTKVKMERDRDRDRAQNTIFHTSSTESVLTTEKEYRTEEIQEDASRSTSFYRVSIVGYPSTKKKLHEQKNAREI